MKKKLSLQLLLLALSSISFNNATANESEETSPKIDVQYALLGLSFGNTLFCVATFPETIYSQELNPKYIEKTIKLFIEETKHHPSKHFSLKVGLSFSLQKYEEKSIDYNNCLPEIMSYTILEQIINQNIKKPKPIIEKEIAYGELV